MSVISKILPMYEDLKLRKEEEERRTKGMTSAIYIGGQSLGFHKPSSGNIGQLIRPVGWVS
jgi:hypothetical protein